MKKTAARRRLDAIQVHMNAIEHAARLAERKGEELRPMLLVTYMRLTTSRLRTFARVTLEEFPLSGDEKKSRSWKRERGRLRNLAQQVLSVVQPEPEDPDHPMHANVRGKKKR